MNTNMHSPGQLISRRAAYLIGSLALQFIGTATAVGASVDALDYPGSAWSPYPVGAAIGVLSWLTFYIKALARAIGEGKLAAAGLDVLPEEGGIREEAELLRSVHDRKHDLETMLLNHILLRLHNVIITLHSAFNTREAVERILSTTVSNIASFNRGEPENVLSRKQRQR